MIQYVLALWIVTHTIALELLKARRKPLGCQLCLSGWICIWYGVGAALNTWSVDPIVTSLAAWALSVLIEAVYQRLQTYIL